MSEPVVRDNFSRGEVVAGLTWLSVGALVSVVLETVYLGWWSFLVALLFNVVLTKTARLWSPRPGVALIPLVAWLAGFAVALALLPPTAGLVALPLAGIAGGVWPLLRAK